MDHYSPPEDKIRLFRSLFRGREDVYPRRFESGKTGKAGYCPACANEWIKGFDKTTGKQLWEIILPASGNATPAMHAADGRQFIVIAARGSGKSKDPSTGEYVAFVLPKE